MFDDRELMQYFLYSYYDEIGNKVMVFKDTIDDVNKAVAERLYKIVKYE